MLLAICVIIGVLAAANVLQGIGMMLWSLIELFRQAFIDKRF